MTAMGAWAFLGTTYSPNGCDSRFYSPALEQVEKMYSQLPRNSNHVVYPDFYGGIAVNGPRLTLLIVENMLEEAQAHVAFGHFFAENTGYRFVEFSFAQLLETRNHVATALSAGRGCFYAGNALAPRISAADNFVEVPIRYTVDRDMAAGFKQYVYDSPMLRVTPGVIIPLWRQPHPIVSVAWMLVIAYVLVGIPFFIIKSPLRGYFTQPL